MKKRVFLSIIVAVDSFPVVLVLLSGLWKMSVFDYGTGLNNDSFLNLLLCYLRQGLLKVSVIS